MCRPWSTTSSPVLTMAVIDEGSVASTRPRSMRAAPTPPARATSTAPPYRRPPGPYDRPMRIAVDATPLLGQPTGVGAFVAGVLGWLGRRDDLEVAGYALSLRG